MYVNHWFTFAILRSTIIAPSTLYRGECDSLYAKARADRSVKCAIHPAIAEGLSFAYRLFDESG
jgi:hypothetical protein